MFTKRIAEINARKAELRKLLETDANANLDEIETELRDLDTEMQSIERRRTIASGISENSFAVPHPSSISQRFEDSSARSAAHTSLHSRRAQTGERIIISVQSPQGCG